MTVRSDVRFPDAVHAALVAAAAEAGRSLNAEVVWRLRASLELPVVIADEGSARSEPFALEIEAKPKESSGSRCPMVVPKGVRCKSCGKVHST